MTARNTVCLCGSTRFLKDFEEANVELTRCGLSVLTISMALPRQPDGSEEEGGLKELLDLVHLNKILRSDAVVVVGGGYVGRSTARELLWATMQGKPVYRACEYAGTTEDGAVRYDYGGIASRVAAGMPPLGQLGLLADAHAAIGMVP